MTLARRTCLVGSFLDKQRDRFPDTAPACFVGDADNDMIRFAGLELARDLGLDGRIPQRRAGGHLP